MLEQANLMARRFEMFQGERRAHAFRLKRRQFLLGGASMAVSGFLASKALAATDPVAAASAAFWQGCYNASLKGAAYNIPAGVTTIYSTWVPDGTILVGVPGKSIIKCTQGLAAVVGKNSKKVTIESLIFDGGDVAPQISGQGLLDFEAVQSFLLQGVTVQNAGGVGISNTGSGGRILSCIINNIGDAGYHSLDSLGVKVGVNGSGNTITNCGNAGVQIWTTAQWAEDGSLVQNNTISNIRADAGGEGEVGNGVNVYNAGGVTVDNNKINQCAFTAVRNNSGSNFAVTSNVCADLGERAMYAEFNFKNARFQNNTITRAAGGIALTNFTRATNMGCGGSAIGNTITDLLNLAPDADWVSSPVDNGAMVGIEAEGDIQVIGNTIVGPARIGVQCGYADALRNVVCELNTIRGADYGIAFATVPLAGPASISSNHIISSNKAAIVSMNYSDITSGDLFGKASPYAPVTIGMNYLN